jgi:uncharacterized protein
MFFGRDARRLFGVYHAPNPAVARESGVVLCYPAPQEYGLAHWAFQKLATLLAEAGLHVLRFDYGTTGDSWGEAHDGCLTAWCDDIATAVDQLRETAGIRRVALVGMRVGAVLALRSLARGVRAKELVLWEPVVDGAAYVDQLEAVEDRRLRLLHYPEPDTRVPNELLGYPFPDAMQTATRAINLLSEPLPAVERGLIVTAQMTPAFQQLQTKLRDGGGDIMLSEVQDRALYSGGGHPNDPLLAHAILVAITQHLSRSGA